jgi:hypothetical protein
MNQPQNSSTTTTTKTITDPTVIEGDPKPLESSLNLNPAIPVPPILHLKNPDSMTNLQENNDEALSPKSIYPL